MKKKLLNFSMSLITFFLIGIVITLLVSFLDYKEIIKPITSNVIISITSSILFFIFSFYSGYKIKKRGLLIGISLFLMYFVVNLILKGVTSFINPINLIKFIIKSLLLISGSIIGVNIANKN